MGKYEDFLKYMQFRTNNEKLTHPLKIEIALTDMCNQKCIHCSNKKKIGKKNKFISLELIKKIVMENPLMLVFSGGEPLLHPSITEYVNIAKSKGINLRILTNGLLIERNLLKELRESGYEDTDVLQISLDGATEDTYYRQRGIYGLKKVCKGIEEAISMGFNIEIHCVPTKLNYLEIIDIIKLADKMSCKKIFFGSFAPFEKKDIDLMCGIKELVILNEEIDYIRNEVDIKILNEYIGEEYFFDQKLKNKRNKMENLNVDKRNQKNKYICAAWNSSCYIDESGNVFPCVFLSMPYMAIGNLQEAKLISLEEIWNRKGIIVKDNLWEMKESKCYTCENWNYCSGGCVGVSTAFKGEVRPGFDPRCYKNR